MRFFLFVTISLVFYSSLVFAEENEISKQVNVIEKAVNVLEKETKKETPDNTLNEKEREKAVDKMDNLSDKLEEIADEYDHQDDHKRTHISIFIPREWKANKKEPKTLFPNEWVFVGLTLRGVLAENKGVSEKLGAEVGISVPFYKGIDLGAGFGSFFAKGDDVYKDVRAHLYLATVRHGPYIGYGMIYEPVKKPYGLLGWEGGHLFAELDFRKGENTPLTTIPQFGIRLRY